MGEQGINLSAQEINYLEQKSLDLSDPLGLRISATTSAKQLKDKNKKPIQASFNQQQQQQSAENDRISTNRSNFKPHYTEEQSLLSQKPKSDYESGLGLNNIERQEYFDQSSTFGNTHNNQMSTHKRILPSQHSSDKLVPSSSQLDLFDTSEMKQLQQLQLKDAKHSKPFNFKPKNSNRDFTGFPNSSSVVENDNSIGALCGGSGNFGQTSQGFAPKRGNLFSVEDSNNMLHQNFNFDFTQNEAIKSPSFSNTLPRILAQQQQQHHQQQQQQLFIGQNRFRESEEDARLKSESNLCPFNQLQQEIVNQTYAMPPLVYSEEEPRYVNAAQFKRMMIMRVKRAARDLKMNKKEEATRHTTNANESLEQAQKSKKYKYESRHKHATNRIRDSKGRFIPKDKLQEYFEQLEREKREKESSFDIESSTQKIEFHMKTGVTQTPPVQIGDSTSSSSTPLPSQPTTQQLPLMMFSQDAIDCHYPNQSVPLQDNNMTSN